MNHRFGRGEIIKEVDSTSTINILDVQVGDTCKFKGTRDKGYRRIMEMNRESYFCRIVQFKKGVVEFTDFTSRNSRDKLDKVYRNGQWSRVVRDSLSK